jgi:hypothetical protein
MSVLAWDIPIFIGWIAIVVLGAIVFSIVRDYSDRRRRLHERWGGPSTTRRNRSHGRSQSG